MIWKVVVNMMVAAMPWGDDILLELWGGGE
jgi:hypothetical protein